MRGCGVFAVGVALFNCVLYCLKFLYICVSDVCLPGWVCLVENGSDVLFVYIVGQGIRLCSIC